MLKTLNVARIKINNLNELAQINPKRLGAFEIIEAGLNAIDTQKVVESLLSVKDGVLEIKDHRFDLHDFKRIRVIGFGKSSCAAAVSLEKILGEKINDGIVIDIRKAGCNNIIGLVGTHPRPSSQNVEATGQLVEMAKDTNQNDLVLVIVSGGGSALLCWPKEECDQGERLYSEFIKTGGTVEELNVVRKHMSSLKGGGLAKLLFPATVVGLVFCDVQENCFENVASGPTYRDETTVQDAQTVLDKYGLAGFKLNETPKEKEYFEKVHNIALVSNMDALIAMADKAQELGFKPEIFSARISESATDVISRFKNLRDHKTAILGGGEITLTVKNGGGSGGRNSYLALCSLLAMKKGDIFISIASDGLDNSDSAGAVADAYTISKANELGLDINDHIARYDSYNFFKKTGDLVFTGPTGANVSDLMILLNKNE